MKDNDNREELSLYGIQYTYKDIDKYDVNSLTLRTIYFV